MLKDLANKIHDEVYARFQSYKTNLFLCGAGVRKTGPSVRDQIAQLLKAGFFFQYEIFYPEDLFDELLYGPRHHDLINLEKILADSVDAVVLVIESYGAVAELGSFASNDDLRKKLICVVDERYKKEKSFINYGPLRLMRDKREGAIVYIDYSRLLVDHIKHIHRLISKVRKGTRKPVSVENVVQAHHFILPCIYLLEPVAKGTLIELVAHASGASPSTCSAITGGALSILNKQREITLSPNGYTLTSAGMIHFRNLGRRSRTTRTLDLSVMDSLRVAVLNWKYRNKSLRV